MPSCIHTLEADHLSHPTLSDPEQASQLEYGNIIYLPKLSFTVDDLSLLSPKICDTSKKNISYAYSKQKISGISANHPQRMSLKKMMHAYAIYARTLVDTILPQYQTDLRWGRTSYRPVEIIGRHRSKRQDDTRVHVDAFPATPVQGWRILRVFCNVNPDNKPRVWHIGEPFAQVLAQFSNHLPAYNPVKAWLLHQFKLTKSRRTNYDHYMLHLHDQMKLNDSYQTQLPKKVMNFPARSTWLVFTDVVSHAALSGQYLLEQTFYLPISAMQHPEASPYQQLSAHGLF